MTSRAQRRPRSALLTTVAVAVGVSLTGPTTYAAPAPPPTAEPTPSPETRAAGGVRSVPLPAGGDPELRTLPARATEPFSLLGLTWDDPGAALDGTVEVRTRDSRTGAWSAWQALEAGVRAPDPVPERAGTALRGGTAPLWTGPADGVQLRARGDALPRGLRLELVDPGQAGGGRDVAGAPPSAPGSPPSADARIRAAVPRPAVVSRSGWGADESLVKEPPKYNRTTKAVFVHHTAGTNNYTCAQSPSIIRAIFRYHVVSQGWNDIGYQFLVDKCGKIFEGRAGGIDRPVQGAHTLGLNVDTSSVSVLGNYMTATSSAAARRAVAWVAAWKLGLYKQDPSGSVTLTVSTDNGKYRAGQRVSLRRISGHRDGSATDCPGDRLYANLPEIRALATAMAAGLTPGSIPWISGLSGLQVTTGDFNGDGYEDAALSFRTPLGDLPLFIMNGTANGFDTAFPTTLFGAGGQALAAGDLNGDGYADLAALTGRGIATFHGSANGLTTTGAPVLDGRWAAAAGEPASASAAAAFAARDTDGDGYDELLSGGVVVAKGGADGAVAVVDAAAKAPAN
ncbi:N-acetylmuramoyl-L-alanine amidase [Streptomyces sp. SCSIO 30461]|uniref:N-acetylmuramoyl-L-alanine amidase n=1 Tax=Streptomyces sp. SCSIO 30461 TaxID=3118085 RepID=UPI0030D2D213